MQSQRSRAVASSCPAVVDCVRYYRRSWSIDRRPADMAGESWVLDLSIPGRTSGVLMQARNMSFSLAVLALSASGLLMSVDASLAAKTGWATHGQINAIIRAWGGGKGRPPAKSYPTAVECKDDGNGPRFRMTYTPMAGSKPFYRWSWVHLESSKLGSAIANWKLPDRLELKYRVVQNDSYLPASGIEWTCAIVYR